MRHLLALCLLVLGLTAVPARAQQTGTVTGVVTDAETGATLPGANVALRAAGATGVIAGAATDLDGRYRLGGINGGDYVLTVTYVGYEEAQFSFSLAGGETRTLDVRLAAGDIGLNDVIVTASRQQEKVLDAPASVTVLGIEDIQQEQAGISSTAVLRNQLGVDMATTGVSQQEIVLRGFNNAFSGATYVLTDYRQAAVPSLGVNVFSIMPNASLDLERVEVVRGPGSALYGAGVDAGVIHFITKDPFTYPGTSVAVTGGERAAFGLDARHAGTIGRDLGYKITGSYARADDWELDPNDPLDAAQLQGDAFARENDFNKVNVNGTLQYRLRPGWTVTANGGYSSLTSTVLSGIGTLQADGFGYTYGQLRLQAGSFFAQAYLNRNDAGDSFVYDSGLQVVDNSTQLVLQAQYDLSLLDGRQRFIVGADADLTNPDTEGTILGRNENETINEYGTYLQSTTNVTDQFDLTLGLRADYNTVVEKVQLSPRAAGVFKITPTHSVRATYNRAFSSPGTNSNFLDIVAADLGGGLKARGRGAAYGFTFQRNPAFAAFAGTDLVASSLNPATLGQPMPVGMPLDALYASVYAGVSAIPDAQLAAMLSQQLGRSFDAQTVATFKQLLAPGATNVQGFSRGALARPNLSTGGIDFVQDVEDVDPLAQTTSQTAEIGYKGLFADKVLFTVDAYYTDKQNFIGPLLVETPLVYVPNLAPDFQAALATGIAGNATLAGALGQYGLTPEQVAAVIAALAQSSATFPDKPGTANDLPVAVVQPNENNGGAGAAPELLLSYRNFGRLQYYGLDAAAQVMVTDALTAFANVSLVSDDFFTNEELDESNTDLAVALNAPALKLKAGYAYSVPGSVSFSMSGRYNQGFPVRSGPYVGTVENYFLLDVGAGYDFARYAPGLRLDVNVQNVLDNDHREFVGAPQIGRFASARLTYTM